MNAIERRHSSIRTRGFTMVETLVALVVLAVGMLGIAGLYVTTLRSSGGAISRMQAVNLASDLADRIRANRTAAAAYAGAAANNNCVGGAVGAVSCAPAAMAANDLFLFQQQIATTWPGGGATYAVAVAVAALTTYTITISWSEPGQTQALTYQLVFQI